MTRALVRRTRHFTLAGASLLALLAAAGCQPAADVEPAPAVAPEVAAPAEIAPDYAAILLSPERPPADVARDATRKAPEVLAFSKVMTGDTVFEIEAGGGYYTELLSRAVGPGGKVVMQSPDFGGFYKADIDARLKDGRLPNVTASSSNFDALDAADGTVDVVTWFQGPHEVFCIEACGGQSWGDPVKSYAEVFRVLKPGGYFVINDHVAPAGAPETTGNDLHRIDPMIVKAAATAAGFVLDEESPLLASTADDYAKSVFDDAVRGKTDQFLLRYVKPG